MPCRTGAFLIFVKSNRCGLRKFAVAFLGTASDRTSARARIEIEDLAGMNRQASPDRDGNVRLGDSLALRRLRGQPDLDRRPVPRRTGALHNAVREIRPVCFGARRNRCQGEHRDANDLFSNMHPVVLLRLTPGQNDNTHSSCTVLPRESCVHGLSLKDRITGLATVRMFSCQPSATSWRLGLIRRSAAPSTRPKLPTATLRSEERRVGK